MGETPRRDLVLPALNAVQARIGWVTRGALNEISRRLEVPPAELWGVVTFYHLLSTTPRPPVGAHVWDDIACRKKSGADMCEEVVHALGPPGAARNGDGTAWMRSPCLGQCERAPAVLVTAAGERARAITVAPVENAEAVLDVLRDPPATADTSSLSPPG